MSVYPNSKLRPGSGEYLRARLQSGIVIETTGVLGEVVGSAKDGPDGFPDKSEDSGSFERREGNTKSGSDLQCLSQLKALVNEVVKDTAHQAEEGRDDSIASVIVRPQESFDLTSVPEDLGLADSRQGAPLNPVDSSDDFSACEAEFALTIASARDAGKTSIPRKLE